QAAIMGQELTYTCVPRGAGVRSGVDRDEDGFYDRDELDAGSDPADAASFPGSNPTLISASALSLRDDVVIPIDLSKRKLSFRSATRNDPVANQIVVPALGGSGDPTLNGATLRVYNATGATDDAVTVALPAAQWAARLGRNGVSSYRF